MAKILRVCNSENFPALLERSPDYVYFVYDKMAIYLGQIYYSDPFCIVEKMPERPVEGMLYITIDGKLQSYKDHHIIDIGTIESEDQLQYLIMAGTTYFMKAEYRYLDIQTKTIQLPFQNGSYQLSVNLAKNVIIDQNTVIRYNPLTSRFEIDGNVYGEEIDKSDIAKDLTGSETDSVITSITNGKVRANIKVSADEGNLIQVFESGLYASIDEFLTDSELEDLRRQLEFYKSGVNNYLAEIRRAVDESDVSVNEDAIVRRIKVEIDKYYPELMALIKNYEDAYEYMQETRKQAKEYTDTKFDETKNQIAKYVDEQLGLLHPWEVNRSFFFAAPGTYSNNRYGGAYGKLYQVTESGAEFEVYEPIMNEIYVINKSNKPIWVRVHLAVISSLIKNLKNPGSRDNIVSLDCSELSLGTGIWNWSTSMIRGNGQYSAETANIYAYQQKIDGVPHVIYVATYESKLEPNEKTLSLIKSLTLNADDLAISNINAIIQDDQWEFPIVVEAVPADEYDDPYVAFETIVGVVGTYNPFNADEYKGDYDNSEDDEGEQLSYKLHLYNKPSINGVILEGDLTLKDLGVDMVDVSELLNIFHGTINSDSNNNTKSENPTTGIIDYAVFSNKPSINGVPLVGDISLKDIGLETLSIDNILEAIETRTFAANNNISVMSTTEKSSKYNYNKLTDIPSIEGIPLIGDITLAQLGIASLSDQDMMELLNYIEEGATTNNG